MVVKYLLLAATVNLFLATASASFLRDANSLPTPEPSTLASLKSVEEQVASAESNVNKETKDLAGCEKALTNAKTHLKELQAKHKALEQQAKVEAEAAKAAAEKAAEEKRQKELAETLAALREKLAKARVARGNANEEFAKQWKREQELQANIKKVSADMGKSASVHAINEAASAKANAEGSGNAATSSMRGAHGGSSDMSGSARTPPCPTVEPVVSKSEPGATSSRKSTAGSSSKSIAGSSSKSTSGSSKSTAGSASETTASQAYRSYDRGFAIPYADAPVATTAAPIVVPADPCDECSESVATAYQRCIATHGDPCKRLWPSGQMKDGSCCLRKEKHNFCLKCAHDHGINKHYYSERSMLLQH